MLMTIPRYLSLSLRTLRRPLLIKQLCGGIEIGITRNHGIRIQQFQVLFRHRTQVLFLLFAG
ncbi:hypothetical protein UU9_13062 [Rhodanobacter fulvus Jip2]|uniref:Uncharacterized protein n=1 Tax=Rhodanobacter fulvus Jip2 TaxID=1163408 RepID=I4VMD8_9GAMM|nr:hypothetical protein UU9_13062 [Rhodanobacter fulvus Jip2]